MLFDTHESLILPSCPFPSPPSIPKCFNLSIPDILPSPCIFAILFAILFAISWYPSAVNLYVRNLRFRNFHLCRRDNAASVAVARYLAIDRRHSASYQSTGPSAGDERHRHHAKLVEIDFVSALRVRFPFAVTPPTADRQCCSLITPFFSHARR